MTLLKLLDGCPQEITAVLLKKACEDLESTLCQNVVNTMYMKRLRAIRGRSRDRS